MPSETVKRKVLLVDDYADTADILAQLLEHQGFQTATAYTGAQALELAETLRPDVVLLDLSLPDCTGFDVCKRLREQPWGKDMLIVAVTGWMSHKDFPQAQLDAFDAFIAKPTSSATITEVIRQCRQVHAD
jgi:CheY-like chemotaxis protein